MNNRKEFEAILVDGLFFNLLPTLDNLRNFLLTPTTEMLNFFQQLGQAP
jgi:hypothetical protein